MELPIFPLSNIVLFPRMVIPIHIFEDRYIRMIKDVIEKPRNEQLFIVATYTEDSDWDIYSTGTVCRILDYTQNLDGTFDMLIVSLMSCEIDEIYDYVLDYRMAVIDINEEDWSGVDTEVMRQTLISTLRDELETVEKMGVNVMDTPFDKLLSIVAFSLPCSTDEKIQLLREYKILRRYEHVLEVLQQSIVLEKLVPSPYDYRIVN